MQRVKSYARFRNALGKVSALGQRDDRVAVCIRRHPVDTLDHQVFQAAEIEAVDKVDH
jgi:hypothetical protein